MSCRIIVFNVQQGLCGFVRTPSGHLLLIDCGKGEAFSPARYVLDHEAPGAIAHNGRALAALVVSHPHDDHIEEIDTVTSCLPPGLLWRQAYNWDYVKTAANATDYENLDTYAGWQRNYTDSAPVPDLGLSCQVFGLTVDAAWRLNPAKCVNNSSLIVVLTIGDMKVLFGGDVEADGWPELLNLPGVAAAVRGVTFYVVSHHGHCSGFSCELYETMGAPPILNIVSAHARDENVDTRYSRQQYASGLVFDDETCPRRMLTTRSDGSVFIDIELNPQNAASAYVHVHRLDDNLPIRAR